MRSIIKYIAIPAVVLAAACQSKDEAKLDDSLSKDLALASQVQPYPQQQFVSPQEMGYNGYGQPQQYQVAQRGGYYQTAPVYSAPAPVRRTSSASRSSGTTVARQPVRNTKRDAVIGAVGGAAVGAVTSRDKVKGAIIGAAAGGILGGIIGHTVDTH
ncbi:MAG: YMGG-like glycine zipper-containing protein [Gemmatimonadaceae bacterium]